MTAPQAQALGERVHGNPHKALYACRGGASRHYDRTEAVYRGLYHHVGQGKDHTLKSSRNAYPQNLGGYPAVGTQLSEAEAECAGFVHQAFEYQSRRNALGNNRGKGDSGNVHFEKYYENKVQDNVYHSGKGEKIKRPFGIAL